MTRPEFIQLVKTDLRTQERQAAILVGLMLVFGAVSLLVAKRMEDADLSFISPALWLLVSLGVLFAILVVYGLRVTGKKLLRCPHCRKCLGGFPAQVVVGCGRCGFCGEQIIDDFAKG